MRHNVFGKKLGRDIKERKALFRQLIRDLIKHGKIKTTLAKAKAVQGQAEKLVTFAKENTDASRRNIEAFLTQKESIRRLMSSIAPRFSERVGGYIRIYRLDKRPGDNAQQVVMEWTFEKSPPKADQPRAEKAEEKKEEKTAKKPVRKVKKQNSKGKSESKK